MTGPYETERQASKEFRSVYDALPRPPAAGEVTRINAQLLTRACTNAGVEVGAYDRLILDWLANWEPGTCGVLAGLISRAYASGQARRP